MSGKDNPQMLLGAYRAAGHRRWSGSTASTAPLWIVAQALRDPGNIGTILRTGDAVGAGGLILIDDCADPFSVEAVRASMGAIFTQADRDRALAGVHRLAALAARASSSAPASRRPTTISKPSIAQPCFLLIGNEQQGLPADYEAECDLLVKIPMAGRADSLNAAMAAAVMAFAIRASWR